MGPGSANSRREQVQQKPLLDHLVGAAEERDRDGEAQRPGRLDVDDQLDFGGLLDRRISGLLALENAGGIAAIRCPRRRLDLRSRQVDRGSLRRNQDSAAASNDFATCHEVAPETHRWRSIISKYVQSDNSIDLWLAPQKLSRLSATR